MPIPASVTDRKPGGPQPPGHPPRLLPTGFAAGPATLAEHLARYGPARSPRLTGPQRMALIEEVERSGLTGRGGAGFPTARKLAAVAAGHAPVVVANGTEGEPASAKDKVLLARSPHLVLDGAVLAAELVGARRAVMVVHRAVREIIDEAVAERRRAGADRIRIEVMTAADRFVAGEASAVVHWIERGIPAPTPTPPRLSARGLGGRPTLVQNVETLAHLALIGRFGASWFRSGGTTAEPGTMLVTVLGAVRGPCVQEIAIGTPVGEILDMAGGTSAPLQALLIGGYFGTWVDAAAAAPAPFSSAGLAPSGASVGAGLIAALPASACGLAETARVTRYLADESAGQCGPCLFGLDAIAGEVQRLAAGSMSGLAMLQRWLGQVNRRGACSHPDGAVRLVSSALTGSQLNWTSTPKDGAAAAPRTRYCPCRRDGSDDAALDAPGRPHRLRWPRRVRGGPPRADQPGRLGLPDVPARPVSDHLHEEAREAIRICPKLALRLDRTWPGAAVAGGRPGPASPASEKTGQFVRHLHRAPGRLRRLRGCLEMIKLRARRDGLPGGDCIRHARTVGPYYERHGFPFTFYPRRSPRRGSADRCGLGLRAV